MSAVHDVQSAWASFQISLNAHRPSVTTHIEDTTSTVPVVLLAGFLGAGKSHLLSQLLQRDHGLRIKAIVNDVGTLQFDPTLIGSASDESVVLVNGCGCCDQTVDISETFARLVNERECDVIVLEASGASDPWSLAHIVEASPHVHLDRIVIVIDERDCRLLESEVTPRQTHRWESSHCVVISHCDAVPIDAQTQLIDSIARVLPGRTVATSSLIATAWQVLLPNSPIGARLNSTSNFPMHEELSVITAVQTRAITSQELSEAIEKCRPGLIRAKGLLRGQGVTFTVQVTPHSSNINECALDDKVGSITLIGRGDQDFQPVLDCIN